MTNPNDAVGTNGAYGGRTSVNAFNDFMNIVSRGIISGWACVPNSGLTVSLGGNGTIRDAAAAEDNAGNKTSINNISGSPIDVTLGAAPGTNSRIDSVVAYVDNPPNGSSSVADNPSACGIIAVAGTSASTPVPPNDSAIRSAITADGASGTTAYYVVLANITIASGTTDITSNMIQAGSQAMISAGNIPDGSITSGKLDFTTFQNVYSSLPLAHAKIQCGWNSYIEATRIGNIVLCSGSFVASGMPQADGSAVNETIPSGYRPALIMKDGTTEGVVYMPFIASQSTDGGNGGWKFFNDGKIQFSHTVAGPSSARRFMYSGSWVTSDPWPSS